MFCRKKKQFFTKLDYLEYLYIRFALQGTKVERSNCQSIQNKVFFTGSLRFLYKTLIYHQRKVSCLFNTEFDLNDTMSII